MSRRRGLVNDVGREVEEMRSELQKAIADTTTTTGGGVDSRLPLPEDFDQDLPPEERDDDYYAAMEEQRQAELMHEQDEQLDGVFRTVGHLREQANDMGRELESQAIMLGEVDTLADRVGGKLQGGMSRLKHIVRQNEGELLSLFLFCSGSMKKANRCRYNVLLLHRGSHFHSRPIINFDHCSMKLYMANIITRGMG